MVLALAGQPNIRIKISGACTLSHEPFPYDDIWDPVLKIIGAFGLDRCMWGTDWTRATELLTYRQGVEPFRVTSRLSDSDRAALMGGDFAVGIQMVTIGGSIDGLPTVTVSDNAHRSVRSSWSGSARPSTSVHALHSKAGTRPAMTAVGHQNYDGPCGRCTRYVNTSGDWYHTSAHKG